MQCKYLKKEGTYSWTTLGLDLTEESYTFDQNGIVIGDELYTREDIEKRLTEYTEKRNAQLAEQTA